MVKLLAAFVFSPVLFSWGIGAAFLNGGVFSAIEDPIDLRVFSHTSFTLCLLVSVVCFTLLGYVLGMFTVWPLMRRLCTRINGGPFRTGDHVLVLAGPYKGKIAFVFETCVGQGGWNLVIPHVPEESGGWGRELSEQVVDDHFIRPNRERSASLRPYEYQEDHL